MTGFTLPGMMLEPGWVSGSASSARPARGPMPISRTSEAIFQRLSAMVRIAPWAAIATSSVAWAWKWFEVSRTVSPVSDERRAHVRNANSGWALMPVPTAVPPSGTLSSSAWAARARRSDSSDLAGVAAEFLAEPDRRRVLEMGPAGLDDGPEFLLLRDERGVESLERRQQVRFDRHSGGQLEGGRDRTSLLLWQRLTASFGWTDRPPPSRAAGEVGEDLVHVRVGRSAGTGLVDVDRELVVVGAVGDLARRRGDGVGDVRVQQAELGVRLRSGELDERKGGRGTGAGIAVRRSGSSGPRAGSRRRTGRPTGTAISPIESRSIRVAAASESVMPRL